MVLNPAEFKALCREETADGPVSSFKGINMDLETAKLIWECIDKLDESEQQKLLSQKLLCDREPIHRFADIRLGDHLVRKGSTIGWNQYEHHFLFSFRRDKNDVLGTNIAQL